MNERKYENWQMKRLATGHLSSEGTLVFFSHLHTHTRVSVHCGCVIYLFVKQSGSLREFNLFLNQEFLSDTSCHTYKVFILVLQRGVEHGYAEVFVLLPAEGGRDL